MSSPAEQYVVNPDTGRLIRRGGPTHRRWKRCHLDAHVLQPVPFHMLTPRLQERVIKQPELERAPTPLWRDNHPYYPSHRRSPSFDAEFPSWPEHLVAQPFMTNRQASCPPPSVTDIDVKMDDIAEVPSTSTTTRESTDLLVDEVLTQHGPALLRAYENPQVDFMHTLADAFGMDPWPETKTGNLPTQK